MILRPSTVPALRKSVLSNCENREVADTRLAVNNTRYLLVKRFFIIVCIISQTLITNIIKSEYQTDFGGKLAQGAKYRCRLVPWVPLPGGARGGF